jgi:hypothetical protein
MLLKKTVRILICKNIQTKTITHRRTAPANRPDFTISTSPCPLTITLSQIRIINLLKICRKDIAEQRRQFATGMNLVIPLALYRPRMASNLFSKNCTGRS